MYMRNILTFKEAKFQFCDDHESIILKITKEACIVPGY